MNLKKLKLKKRKGLIEDGIYKATLIDSVVKTSKNGRPMLRLTWEIAEGPYAGQKLYSYIVMDSEESDKIVAIVFYSLGLNPTTVKDSSVGHGKKCRICVVIEENKGFFGNSIKLYYPLEQKNEDVFLF